MEPDPQRLADYVRRRRQELGLSQLEVAARGGPSDTTLSKVEAAIGSPNRQTLSKLDLGLSWVRGSARRVLEGGEPDDDEPPAPYYDWQRLADHVRRRREESGLSHADIAARGGLPEETVAAIEAGRRVRNQRTLLNLDRALGWLQGSAERVLKGGEPSPWPRLKEPSPGVAAYRGTLSKAHHPGYQPRRLADLTYEDLFDRWARLVTQMLGIEIEYMKRRGLSQPSEAHDELWAALVMADQGRDGRPWVPPWEEMSDDEAQDHLDSLRDAGLIDEHGEPIVDEDEDEDEGDTPPRSMPEPELPDPAGQSDLAHPPMSDWSQGAARHGQSEGRQAREQRDGHGEE